MRRVREAAHADEGEYDRDELVVQLEKEMLQAAEELDFERAAALRDHIQELKQAAELKVPAAKARPDAAAAAPARDTGAGWKPKSQHRRAVKKKR